MQVSKLFEPKKIGETSLGGKVVSYFILIVWATIVIFPIYWLFITSFKLPEDVKFYPTYLPWIDFNPSLHAWENILFGDSEYFPTITKAEAIIITNKKIVLKLGVYFILAKA